MKEPTIFHSVRLEEDKCVGCTTCIKQCPTEAIRVRKGRASIIAERCIDCGQCIRTCPHDAKKAVSDPLSMIEDFRLKVAIPAPSLYSQFPEATSVDSILSGLLALGFDEIFEVAEAAELVTDATRVLLEKSGLQHPLISSACPAIVKLVQLRFPSLIPQLVPLLPPMEVAARVVKERLHAGEEGVGVFFIAPCAGKVTVTRSPLGYERSALDGVIGIKDIYLPLRAAITEAKERPLAHAGGLGIGWGRVDGETEALGERRAISVDGIGNVIGVLEALENGTLRDVAYIEALACPSGCVGGPLNVENPYIAKNRLKSREAAVPYRAAKPSRYAPLTDIGWTQGLRSRLALALDPDMLKALVMMEEMELLAKSLPGLDCGSCGAPTCRAFAEDIVRGEATESGCVFKLRENVRKLARELIALEEIQPPGLDREEKPAASRKS